MIRKKKAKLVREELDKEMSMLRQDVDGEMAKWSKALEHVNQNFTNAIQDKFKKLFASAIGRKEYLLPLAICAKRAFYDEVGEAVEVVECISRKKLRDGTTKKFDIVKNPLAKSNVPGLG
jgi:hypothetical protein